MGIDLERLRADARHLKSTRAGSPIGKPKTGATAIIRKYFAEFSRLHSEEDVHWTELAAALADQGVIQGDGQRLTGRRLTALMLNVARQIEKHRKDKADRMKRNDLAVPALNRHSAGKLALAPELTHKQIRTMQHEPISEDEIRQAQLARHARLLSKK